MPRARPRYDWKRHPEDQSQPFSVDDLSEIIGTVEYLLLHTDDDIRERFGTSLQSIGLWYKVARHQHGMPTNAQVAEALWEVHNSAKTLSRLISRLDDVSVEALLRQRGRVRDIARENSERIFDAQLVRQGFGPITTLAEEARAAVRWVEDRGERPNEVFDPKLLEFVKTPFQKHRKPTIALIKKLADLFKQATDQEPAAGHDWATESYSGPFFAFVSTVFEKLGESRESGGLGRTIDDALTERRDFLEALGREDRGTN